MDLMAVVEVTMALVLAVIHARLISEFNPGPNKFELAFREYELALPHQLSKLESEVSRKRGDHTLQARENETEIVFYKSKTEDDDIVDREDHVTQYLSEMMVNTDSEITSLQVNEYDES